MSQLNEQTPKSNPVVNVSNPHDSAHKHVSGEARYIDDIPEPRGLAHAYTRLSERTHARITKLELDAVRQYPGVYAVVSAADLHDTTNDIGTAFPGDVIFADGEVQYNGQPIFAVAATSREVARRAAMCATIEYGEDLPAILTIDEALAAESKVRPTKVWDRGNPDEALAKATHRLQGRTATGEQEQFYLEGQASLAVPQEDGDMLVYSSTQGPSGDQRKIAQVLGVPDHAVTVENRRMGGGFGGKETQAAWFACMAAVLAQRTNRPVKIRLDRDDDMIATGKRHAFQIEYDVGFDDDGRIQGIHFIQSVDAGYAPDLTHAVADRGMYHADNAYFLENVRITSHRLRTNKCSFTAFRGFGGPQGIVGIEEVIEVIARHLHKDPLEIRKLNFYGTTDRNITPYDMEVRDNIIHDLVGELENRVDYKARRKAVAEFNASHKYLKKGLALTPVKFGISFTTKFQNQGGALVLVYLDGSVQLSHGGTDMGQGVHTKVAQVVAEVFGIDLERIRITPTTTGKVPNTSPTSASTGADLNGAAAYNAAMIIVERLRPFLRDHFTLDDKLKIEFRDNSVFAGDRKLGSFAEIISLAYFNRIQLSAAGFYKTPTLVIDEDGRGRPFYYFAYGACCSEVTVDTLTGEYRMTRADILHDAGNSLNPAIDIGQIEGGFIQGAGWLTTEELWWNPAGKLMTHAPSTYKIPACSDVPEHFHTELYKSGNAGNVEASVYRSKAVGEPPLPLGIAVLHALKDAVAAVGDYQQRVQLDAPATPEAVFMAVESVRAHSTGTTPPTSTKAPVTQEGELVK